MSIFGKKETDFFALFSEGLSYSVNAAKQLKLGFADGVVDFSEMSKIKDIEHEGDKFLHRAFSLIDKAFITPIDRMDIVELIKSIECITDSIDSLTNHIYMLRIVSLDEYVKRFIDLVERSCEKLGQITPLLHDVKKNSKKINENIVAVNQIEEEGDQIFKESMRALFVPGNDPINIIKMKEIYEHFEDVLDKCEDAADLIEKILISKS